MGRVTPSHYQYHPSISLTSFARNNPNPDNEACMLTVTPLKALPPSPLNPISDVDAFVDGDLAGDAVPVRCHVCNAAAGDTGLPPQRSLVVQRPQHHAQRCDLDERVQRLVSTTLPIPHFDSGSPEARREIEICPPAADEQLMVTALHFCPWLLGLYRARHTPWHLACQTHATAATTSWCCTHSSSSCVPGCLPSPDGTKVSRNGTMQAPRDASGEPLTFVQYIFNKVSEIAVCGAEVHADHIKTQTSTAASDEYSHIHRYTHIYIYTCTHNTTQHNTQANATAHMILGTVYVVCAL